MSKLKEQPGGTHYKHNAIQPVEFIHANYIGFLEGCVIKRMVRWRNKGGMTDLRKAIHEIELLIELEAKRDARVTEDLATQPPEYPLRICDCDGMLAQAGQPCRCPPDNPRDYAPGDEVDVPQDRQNGPLAGDVSLPVYRVLEGEELPVGLPNGTIVEGQRPIEPFTTTRKMQWVRIGVMLDEVMVPDRPW